MKAYLLVFVGGGLGSALRLGVNHLCALLLPPSFPFATLAVNAIGGLAAGLAAGLFLTRPSGAADPLALFLITGMLGGFTTFSAFSLESLLLWQRGEQLAAAGYVVASVALAVAGAAAGMAIVRAG